MLAVVVSHWLIVFQLYLIALNLLYHLPAQPLDLSLHIPSSGYL